MSTAVLTLSRYPARHIVTAFHSMALFRPSLALNKAISFHKLVGTGRNGTFDKNPDWRQYGIFSVSEQLPDSPPAAYEAWRKAYYGSFIHRYWNWAGAETGSFILEPILSHGQWDGQTLFPDVKGKEDEGPVAVLTRATIRLSRAREFWSSVPAIRQQMDLAPGLLFSVGIGEMPYLRQATFSVWKNGDAIRSFAYRMQEHRDVIQRTRARNWYSEEMFTRFRVLHAAGPLLKGKIPATP